MAITPATIYINVNVIFVESHNKTDKGDYNIKHSSTGEIVLLVMILILVKINILICLQHVMRNTIFVIDNWLYNSIYYRS